MRKLDRKILEQKISNVKQAKILIDELHTCNKVFHFDDDPVDIGCFSTVEAYLLDLKVDEMLKLNNHKDWGEDDDCYGYALRILNI
jgi:hypothetical protein